MAKLAEPEKRLAARILQEVGFEERLVGVKMAPMAGSHTQSIYSFQEAVAFLQLDNPGELLSSRGRSVIGYLDPEVLAKWVAETFGDTELSLAIKGEIGQEAPYVVNMKKVQALLKQRLEQCERVLNG